MQRLLRCPRYRLTAGFSAPMFAIVDIHLPGALKLRITSTSILAAGGSDTARDFPSTMKRPWHLYFVFTEAARGSWDIGLGHGPFAIRL